MERGNASIIEQSCLPISPLVMLRLEAMAEFLTEEPLQIGMQLDESGDVYDFEQVFRIRKWVPNDKLYSWCVYAEERNFSCTDASVGGIVIRLATWDKRADIEKLKGGNKGDREKLLGAFGSFKTENTYLNAEKCMDIVQQFAALDSVMKAGIILQDRPPSDVKPLWSNFEVCRRFGWGQVHVTWNLNKTNRDIEEQTTQLEQILTNQTAKQEVHRLILDYSIHPAAYRSNITG